MNNQGELGHSESSTVEGGVFVITSPPSSDTDAEGNPIFRGPLLYTFSGGTIPGASPITGIQTTTPQTINPTAEKSKNNVLAVIREGDSGTMNWEGVQSGGPVTGASGVEVVEAGQAKAKAN